ncbi:MAG: sensor histidine kinase [Rhodobacteraceae bacterium]|nr:sensor histidine kinase [Paracoccaceae bacterium]
MPLTFGIRRQRALRQRDAEVVLGDDWVAPERSSAQEITQRNQRRRLVAINRSPLARKIIAFNLMALVVLVSGVLYLNASSNSLVSQHEAALAAQAELVADVFEAKLPSSGPVNLVTGEGLNAPEVLAKIDLPDGVDILVFDRAETLIATTENMPRFSVPPVGGIEDDRSTLITDMLISLWEAISLLIEPLSPEFEGTTTEELARSLLPSTLLGITNVGNGVTAEGNAIYSVATPIVHNGQTIAIVALTSAAGEIDLLVRSEREQVLQVFVVAIVVSLGLSLVLASTIANPIADLAAAAESGRDRNDRQVNLGRIRIPDLSARPDEIGRLSGALRGMVSALYDRIDANEQFAADVAHEIKNPLASLRSAVGTLRVAKRDDQRDKLLDVIDHDVRRLDRLVSDISNASRLDSELVREEEENFDLLTMLRNLTDFLGREATEKGIEFIADYPDEPVMLHGLEARLAQVFVNLITNAISFCGEGDAIRVWTRRRENRVLVVVEDTGPGIPEGALGKIFNRFYTERPEDHFGNNSGLGLAISKQIIEAHGGVIWAENIRPTGADSSSTPLGARFVVGLPL